MTLKNLLLTIDIGNTNIVIGVFEDTLLLHHWRLETSHKRTEDEYYILLQNLWREILPPQYFARVILSSVVPNLTTTFRKMFQEKTGQEPLIISKDLRLPITLAIYPPETTGSDLIVNAVAAYTKIQQDVIVVDFGTATTIMFVKSPGVLMGGAIATGLNTTLDALVSKTAQLPAVAITPPPSVIGNNSVHALQSGLVLGHISMVEGLIARMRQEIGHHCPVIATGGLASTLAPLSSYIDVIDPWLTLEGLRLIAEFNQ